jgi:hypothetical protein
LPIALGRGGTMNFFESSIMNFALSAAADTEGAPSRSFLETLWGIFSGRYAIGFYIIVILAVIIALIIVMISEENKLSELMSVKPQEKSKIKIDVEANAKVNGIGEGSGEGYYADDEAFEESGSRFYMLDKTDREMAKREPPRYDDDVSLKQVCEQFRHFAASRMGLYYDISDIRRFISGMAVTHILIMQGMSGTGKTSLAYAFGEFLNNHSVIVPIQPMWKEKSDLVGYYNEFTKRFNETVLLQKMYEANYTDDIYITVLDEMNIARVEYYFAEFLSLLELPNPESRRIDVVSDEWRSDPKLLRNGQLKLPENMWFVGTANNDDSTFAISDKVYDRAMVMNLDRKSEVFDAPYTEGVRLSQSRWKELVAQAKEEYGLTSRSLRKIKKLDAYMIEKCNITFGNRIMKQIKEYVPVYVACGGEESAAIDDILSRKVMRKLESQNPIYVKKIAEEFCNYIDDVFGTDKMPLCKDAIRNIARNA